MNPKFLLLMAAAMEPGVAAETVVCGKMADKRRIGESKSRVKVCKSEVMLKPLRTEAAVRRMKEQNALSLLVDRRADKKRIKEAVEEAFECRVEAVNTVTRPDGFKAAFIKLPAGYNALELANKVGLV